ncbi:MAG: hypothetical protein ACREDL_15735 [Bradyrhizobium sp.]
MELDVDIILPVAGYFAAAGQQLPGKKRMRRQLYREMAKNYRSLGLQVYNATSIPGIAAGAPLRFEHNTDLSFSVFTYYNSEARLLAPFDLEEADVVTRYY